MWREVKAVSCQESSMVLGMFAGGVEGEVEMLLMFREIIL